MFSEAVWFFVSFCKNTPMSQWWKSASEELLVSFSYLQVSFLHDERARKTAQKAFQIFWRERRWLPASQEREPLGVV